MITGKPYDWLKWIAQVVLPGLGTLYFTLAGIWGLPNADAVVGTIMAIDLFLGLILGISQVNYAKSEERFDGEMDVRTVGDKKTVQMAFNDHEQLEQLTDKKEVLFKVNHEGEAGLTLIETVIVGAFLLALAALLVATGVFK